MYPPPTPAYYSRVKVTVSKQYDNINSKIIPIHCCDSYQNRYSTDKKTILNFESSTKHYYSFHYI